jgi:hypothetical protein
MAQAQKRWANHSILVLAPDPVGMVAIDILRGGTVWGREDPEVAHVAVHIKHRSIRTEKTDFSLSLPVFVYFRSVAAHRTRAISRASDECLHALRDTTSAARGVHPVRGKGRAHPLMFR